MDLKKAILSFDDKTVKPIPEPCWGQTLYVRNISGADRAWLDSEKFTLEEDGGVWKNKPNFEGDRLRTIVVSLCDKEGTLIFERKDWQLLATKCGVTLARIYQAAAKLNLLDADEAAKKSGQDQSESSGSSSPDTSAKPSDNWRAN